MSGRTFGVQSSWDDVFRQLGLDVDPASLRKGISIADSMNQQIEEFLNRFVTTSLNDSGDITFDAAGTYTFDGDVVINGDLTSSSWVSETSGWKLFSDTGAVEFNDGTFRGSLEAGDIHIPDTTTAASFHVDSDGDVWVGTNVANKATAPFSIDSATGDVVMNEVNLTGSMVLSGGDISTDAPGEHRTLIGTGAFSKYTYDFSGIQFYAGTVGEAAGFIGVGEGSRDSELWISSPTGTGYPDAPQFKLRSNSSGGYLDLFAGEVDISGDGGGSALADVVITGYARASKGFFASVQGYGESPRVGYAFGTSSSTRSVISHEQTTPTDAAMHFDVNGNALLELTSVNNQVLIPAGTASNPSLGFLTDKNTGIYRTGANTVGLSSGGTAIASFDTNQAQFDTDVEVNDGRLWVKNDHNGRTTVLIGDDSLLLTAHQMNASSKYTPPIIFGSTDPAFTTENPKALAAIVGVASEAYGNNSDGGMYLEFVINGNNPGTANAVNSSSHGYLMQTSGFKPRNDNVADCGGASNRWDDVYATNGTIITSDLREKRLAAQKHRLGLDFLLDLEGIAYRRKGGGKRIHHGIGAQTVVEALEAHGHDPAEHAIWVEGDGRLGVRHDELWGPQINANREIDERLRRLEAAIMAS